MSYIDQLIANCQQAKTATPTSEFVLGELAELKGIGNAIYIIEQTTGSPQNTYQAMAAFKAKKTRACPALNQPSRIMYVGSSTTSLHNRSRQHMGDGPARTYALHLNHWCTDRYKITIRTYDLPRVVLQIVEDDLSHSLQPAFGKAGPNNK